METNSPDTDNDDAPARNSSQSNGGSHERLWALVSALLITTAAVILFSIVILVIVKTRRMQKAQRLVLRRDEGSEARIDHAKLFKPMSRPSWRERFARLLPSRKQPTDQESEIARQFYERNGVTRWDPHERKSTDGIMCTKALHEIATSTEGDLKTDDYSTSSDIVQPGPRTSSLSAQVDNPRPPVHVLKSHFSSNSESSTTLSSFISAPVYPHRETKTVNSTVSSRAITPDMALPSYSHNGPMSLPRGGAVLNPGLPPTSLQPPPLARTRREKPGLGNRAIAVRSQATTNSSFSQISTEIRFAMPFESTDSVRPPAEISVSAIQHASRPASYSSEIDRMFTLVSPAVPMRPNLIPPRPPIGEPIMPPRKAVHRDSRTLSI